MVTEWGYSDALGPLRYSENEQELFLGHSVTQRQNVSEETAAVIDKEIRRLVEDGEKRAWDILTEYREELETITRGLLEYETLSKAEIDSLIKGEKIREDDDKPAAPKEGGRRGSVPTAKSSTRKPKSGGASGGFDPEPQPGV